MIDAETIKRKVCFEPAALVRPDSYVEFHIGAISLYVPQIKYKNTFYFICKNIDKN